jgi:hypothetical protein
LHFTRNLFFRVPPIKAVVNADILMCQGLINCINFNKVII